MIRSMTGFSTQSLVLHNKHERTTITLSLKSLNARYFEITSKLSHTVASLETECAKIIKERLVRGHIYFTIYNSNTEFFKGNIEPALGIIAGYVDAMSGIKEQFKLSGDISVDTIMQLPHAFHSSDQPIDDQSKRALIETLNQVISQLIAQQEHEGAELEKDMVQRIAHMKDAIEQIKKRSVTLLEEHKEKINATAQEFLQDTDKFTELQKNNLFATLDKMDTHEEVVRFHVHLQSLQTLVAAQGIEKGKRLEFTLQELGREINTIASKCADTQISALAIDIKVDLEKIREQVQNII